MAKFLAVFNVVAGGASVIGLYVTLLTPYNSTVLAVLFALTLALCVYVLFVPGNRLESNVESHMRTFREPGTGNVVAVQRGEFKTKGRDIFPVEFPQPFTEPPTVELVKLGGHEDVRLRVRRVTELMFEVENPTMVLSHYESKYRWLAKGSVLQSLPREA